MESSGVTAVSTSGDGVVTAIAASAIPSPRTNIRIVNEGAPSGWFSIDGGTTWHRLPGTAASTTAVPVVLLNVRPIFSVQVKRIASGTDLANVFVTVW
jgi:hypothetical protein